MRYAHNNHRSGTWMHTAFRTVGLCAGVALLGWSCQRREEPSSVLNPYTSLNVAASFASLENPSNSAPRSKATTLESFTPNDQVGLFIVYRDKNNAARPLSGVVADSANLCYTANAAGILGRVAPATPVYYDKLNPYNVDLYGYFPFDAALTPAKVGAYEFTVAKDQNTAGKMAASDLCWAKNEKGVEATPVTPSAKPVEMHFKHRFSKILITVRVPKTLSDSRTVTDLTHTALYGILPTAVLNLSTGAMSLPTDAAKKVPVSIVPLAGTATEDPTWKIWQFEAIIPAQTLTVDQTVVGFQVKTSGADESLVFYAPKNLFGTHGLTCQSGIQYEWTLSVGSSTGPSGGGGKIEVKLDGSSIDPWKTNTPPVTGDLTNSITTRFSCTNAAITSAITHVKVTTNESATVYDITTGLSITGTTCSFAFTRLSSSPRDYGFSITKLEFLNGATHVHTWNGTSARVYSPTSMPL